MKKILLGLICSLTLLACTKTASWTEQQKKDFKEEIKNIKGLDYLANMTQEEFDKFSNDVATSIEANYPDYTVFYELPSVNDTISTYVITSFAYKIDSDYRTLHNLYPYPQLVKDGLLPDGMTKEAKEAFYSCLASKLKNQYGTMLFFLGAIGSYNTSDSDQAKNQCMLFQQQCATEVGAVIITESVVQ